MDADDIAGIVTSAAGPEAGVWVIAETGDLPTRFAKIVVTDDQGRYLVPDLPAANYKVWVRGYGLADSAQGGGRARQGAGLTATAAPDAATAAKVYPAAYWYAMLKLPTEAEVAQLRGGRNEYLMWMKNMGCVGCHQLGNLATRTLPPSLGKFNSLARCLGAPHLNRARPAATWCGPRWARWAACRSSISSEWTDRIARGELPAQQPQRPQGIERNVVATVRDWSSDKPYMHDLSGTDRRNPTVNGYGPLYGAPELSTDEFPILDPRRNTATTFHAPVRDADTPTTHDDPVVAPSPYWGDEAHLGQQGERPQSDARCHGPRLVHGAHPRRRQSRVLQARLRSSVGEGVSRRALRAPARGVRSGHEEVHVRRHLLRHASPAVRRGRERHAVDQRRRPGGRLARYEEVRRHGRCGRVAGLVAARARHQRQRPARRGGSSPDQPADAKLDTRIAAGFYAVMPNPADGSVWGSVAFQYPGAILRFDPQTQLTEIYTPPLPGFGVRGADIDSQRRRVGIAGQRAPRRVRSAQVQGAAERPDGHRRSLPGRLDAARAARARASRSCRSSASNRATTPGWTSTTRWASGKDVPIATGNLFDGVHALVGDEIVTLRIPYPLGFYMKGVEGRIDDPNAGWKGRGLWVPSGDRTPWLKEGGKGTKPLVVHFQMRPDPLAK